MVNGIYDEKLNNDYLAYKYTGKDPDKWGRYYLNVARYLLFFLSGNRIDLVTPKSANQDAGKCSIFGSPEEGFNKELFDLCIYQYQEVYKLGSNALKRKFNSDFLCFEDELR